MPLSTKFITVRQIKRASLERDFPHCPYVYSGINFHTARIIRAYTIVRHRCGNITMAKTPAKSKNPQSNIHHENHNLQFIPAHFILILFFVYKNIMINRSLCETFYQIKITEINSRWSYIYNGSYICCSIFCLS